MHITQQSLIISSVSNTGVLYGVQTLLQLFYATSPVVAAAAAAALDGKQEENNKTNANQARFFCSPRHPVAFPILLRPCYIEDVPKFAYRGIMLDVARHFLPLQRLYSLLAFVPLGLP